MGRTPYVAQVMREFVEREDILAYLEAVLRVYNEDSRRDNIHKQRIKILINTIGPEEMRRRVALRIRRNQEDGHAPSCPQRNSNASAPISPPPHSRTGLGDEMRGRRTAISRTGIKTNIHAHRAPGYAIVTVSLKSIGRVPGDASHVQMDALADLMDRYGIDEIRVSHEPGSRAPACEKTRFARDLRACSSFRNSISRRPMPASSPISSAVRDWIIAISPMRARSRSPRISPGASPTSPTSTKLVNSRSRFLAASTPVAIITPAISGSSASIKRASNITSFSSAVRAPRMPRSARSWGRGFPRTRSPTRWSAWSASISNGARETSVSSTPTGALAWPLSRWRPMKLIKQPARSPPILSPASPTMRRCPKKAARSFRSRAFKRTATPCSCATRPSA